jgi:hypothetical protein
MELLTLREELETLLADYLGTYTLANNTRTPAISVRAAGESSPARTVVSGLECIIQKQPRLTQISQYSPAGAFRSYTIFLVSWDDSDITSTGELISNAFPTAVTKELTNLQVPQGQGPQNQMRISLQFNPTPVEVSA